MSASELVDQFRNGNLRRVAEAVLCDGPTALQVAVLLTSDELARLSLVVTAHLDKLVSATPPTITVGGEARGGPVRLAVRGRIS